MTTMHAPKSRHANLRNAKVSEDSSLINCSECILVINKNVIDRYLKESSSYQHSAKKGTDQERKLPEWAILGFKSYTTPNYAIRSIIKASNPSMFFTKTDYNILVTLRNLDPSFDSQVYLEAFVDMWHFFFVHYFDAHPKSLINFSITQTVLSYRDANIPALSVKCDMGYLMQYILMIHIGKMANILVHQPDVDKMRLVEQIFSNQSNTSHKNYRSFMKVLLNGDIVDLWDNPSSYGDLIPQITKFDLYSTILPPRWLSIHLSYRSEIKLAEMGLFY